MIALSASEMQERTDWEAYYRRPFPASWLTRQIFARHLLKAIADYRPDATSLRVLEIGGGNSCFLPALFERFHIERYTIIDSCQLGVDLVRESAGSLYGARVLTLCADIFERPSCGKHDLVPELCTAGCT